MMADWKLHEKSLNKWESLQHDKSIIPDFFLQGMANNVEFIFSVVETMRAV